MTKKHQGTCDSRLVYQAVVVDLPRRWLFQQPLVSTISNQLIHLNRHQASEAIINQ